MSYGKEKKQIVFEELDKKHADLRIRLHYDGIKQGEFFRCLIDGYLKKNEHILQYLENYKNEKNIQSIDKIKKSKKLLVQGKETERSFALTDKEINNIFDMLEKEHDELWKIVANAVRTTKYLAQ